MKKAVKKRLLCLCLCIILCLSLVPAAYAEDALTEVPPVGDAIPGAPEVPTEEPAEELPAEDDAPGAPEVPTEEPAEEPPAEDDAPGVPEAPAEEPAEEAPAEDGVPGVPEAPAEEPAEEAPAEDGVPGIPEEPVQEPAEELPEGDDTPAIPETPAEDRAGEAEQTDEPARADGPSPVSAAASEWTYELDEENHAVITGYSGSASSVQIPAFLDGYMVTVIGVDAFNRNTTIKSVTIPDGVTRIGVDAFSRCPNLEKVTIPESVRIIDAFAFRDSGLKSFTLPGHIESLGQSILSGVSGVTSLVIPKTIRYGEAALQNSALETVIFENGLTRIPDKMLASAKKLTSVTIPGSVTAIGSSAFSGCLGLERITIPDTVTEIGAWAFYACNGLKEVRLGAGITEIPEALFNYCLGIETLVLPAQITSIGERAFVQMLSLKKLYIPPATTSIAYNAFSTTTSATIYGFVGTRAESYAKEYKIQFAGFALQSAANADEGIRLTWTDMPGVAKYAVLRKAGTESGYTQVAAVAGTTYTDSTAVGGTYYYYRVRCLDASGRTIGSLSAARGITCSRNMTPKIISIANTVSGVKLTWGAVSGVPKYAIYRKAQGESKYTRISISTTTSYTDRSAVSGTYYYYRIWSMNSSNVVLGEWSTARGITCVRSVTPTITSIANTASGVKVTWNTVPGVAKYAIYRKSSTESSYKRISVRTTASYVDQSALDGTYYYYRIWSLDANGKTMGEWSNARAITCKR